MAEPRERGRRGDRLGELLRSPEAVIEKWFVVLTGRGGGRWVRVVLISLVNELDGDDK
jgi:hypothetical protein